MTGLCSISLVGILFVALSSWTQAAEAITGDTQQFHNIDLPRTTPPSQKATAAVLQRLQGSPAWGQWRRAYPGWQAQWNVQSASVHRAWGPDVRIANLPPTQATIENDCRILLAQTSAWSGIDATQLRLLHARFRLNRWYVTFEQTFDGIAVFGGRVDLRVAADGQLMLLGADWIRATPPTATAALDVDAALQAAQVDFASPTQRVESQRRVLVAIPTLQGAELRWAEEIVFRTETPLGLWHCLVDAQSGRTLLRQNQMRFADVMGNISAQVEPNSPGDATQLLPLQDTRLNIGSGLTQFGFTDASGDFNIPVSGVDSVNVFLRLAGLYARVYNEELGHSTPRIDAKILPGSPRNFVWDDSNSRASERDAYAHTLITHDFIKQLDPAFTGVDYIMPVVVDIGGRECNAWWDGTGINFLAAGNRCANIARIADVVYHEYGHGITDWQYRPLAPSGAMHEGFSDYLAATMRNDPLIGNGFFGPGSSIRTIDNNMRTPEDLTGQVHNDGLIIAAALWDLRAVLGAALTDTLFHYARYGLSDNFDDYMLDVLVTDDDNGNIYDGTPNFDAIITAFEAHGIGDYSVQISHDPISDTEDIAKPLAVESTILSLFPLDVASLMVHYRVNAGTWQQMLLQDAGGIRNFVATLPTQASGSTVDYWLQAADTQGNQSRWPATAPTVVRQFRIGPDLTPPAVQMQPLANRPLDAPGWSVRSLVSDNLDRGIAGVDLLWSRGNAGLGQTLPMAMIDNTTWSAAIPPGGAGLGDVVHYALVATDSAASPNTTRVPDSASWSFLVVQGFLRDFEPHSGGMSGNGDWQWGIPSIGPESAWSGDRVWATSLAGGYENDRRSELELPLSDFGTWQSAALSFQHWLAAEEFYDGGRVEISVDNGNTWQLLEPDGGYPWDFIEEFSGPGFSGTTDGWESVAFDLSRFLGMTARIRLQFASDGGVTDLGWYIDDIEVAERQILAVPLQLAADSGGDTQVPLRWTAPAGIDSEQANTPLTGYNVYRGVLPDLSDAVLLNQAPVSSAQYVDNGVTNGVHYHYAVTALYASGESRRSASVTAQPFRANYSSAVQELVVEAPVGASVDTSVAFANTGTGFLEINAWMGTLFQEIDEVRIAWDVPVNPAFMATPTASAFDTPKQPATRSSAPPAVDAAMHGVATEQVWAQFRERLPQASKVAERRSRQSKQLLPPPFTVLFEDPDDSIFNVDLKEFAVANDAGDIFFRVTGHAPWGNILSDFTVIINIDSDANRSTGDASGADHYVLVGAFPMFAVGVPAIISNPEQEILGIPTHVSVPLDGDFLEVGFAASLLGDLQRVYLSATAVTPDLTAVLDGMPNPSPVSSWLTLGQAYLSIDTSAPQALPLSLASGLPPNAYNAQLLLETNDPSQAIATLPVQFRSGVTPVALHNLTALQLRNDVHVTWRTTLEQEVQAYRVFRSRDGGPFTALSPDVRLQAQQIYAFDDRQVAPGLYAYRIGEVAKTGEVTLHGLVQIQVIAAAPTRAFLDPNSPNPFNPATTLQFGVDRAGEVRLQVFDARGRFVRTLLQEAHMAAGFHSTSWNGRDAQGRTVASGIYYARLIVNGRHISRRMTLLK